MPKRRTRRKPVILDAEGQSLGTWYDPRTWGRDWMPSAKYPDMDYCVVDAGTLLQANENALFKEANTPRAGFTTWYRLSDFARENSARAAIVETVTVAASNAETAVTDFGAAVVDTGGAILDGVKSAINSLVPILVGLAALWILMNSSAGNEYAKGRK